MAKNLTETRWPADHIERWPLDRLMPYARNSRIHTPTQIRAIARSIEKFGWTTPVLADDTGRLIAGHARVLAAKHLKLKEIPVMIATGWSDDAKKAYTIADNRLAEGEFDNDMLVMELGELAESAFDLTLTGFDANSLEYLLAPPAGEGDQDDAEEDEVVGRGNPPAITITVPDVIEIASVAATVRKAIKAAGYRGVKVREKT